MAAWIGGDLIQPQRPLLPKDEGVTTGSIVLVPQFGDKCRTRLIDNATWRIWDNGVTDCRTALTPPDSHQLSAARVDVIRDGFRRH